MRLTALVAGLVDAVSGDAEIDHATLDIGEVRPGTLFCARRAWWGDTHGQLTEAAARGASALLVSRREGLPPGVPCAFAEAEDPALGLICDRLLGAPTLGLRVYGVTGTNGKTSVACLLTHVLGALGERPALMGTLGYRFEDARVEASNTTPDALVIQRFAADAKARGATALVLEVSSHALALRRTAGVAFDSVGFTNLTRDHLDFHGTVEAYAAAKRRLFGEALREAAARGKAPGAAACVDDPVGETMLAAALGAKLAVALDGDPEAGRWVVRAGGPPTLDGTDAVLATPAGEARVRLPLIGPYNLKNAALAVAMTAATHPGRAADAWSALADFPGVPGRLERAAPDVFVDYAHTPDAVERALAAVRACTDRPLTVVLGCGGDRDPGKRPLMAAAAAAGGDHVVLTADNPRSEDAEAILDAMSAGLPPGASAERVVRRDHAIAAALARGGVTVIAGKGHEAYQEVAGRRFRFDDRVEARRLARAAAEGVAPDDAPLAWSEADPVAAARARRGGLWIVSAPRLLWPAARAALAPLVGDAVATDPAELAPCHRVLLITDGPADLTWDGAPLDWPAAHAARPAPGAPAVPPRPHVPTLGRGGGQVLDTLDGRDTSPAPSRPLTT